MGNKSSAGTNDIKTREQFYIRLAQGYSRELKLHVHVPHAILELVASYIPVPQWSSIHGGRGGRAFQPLNSDGFAHKITGIEICGGAFVDSIRAQVNGQWRRRAGGSGGRKQNLILQDNEYFTSVQIRSGLYVDRLRFTTNRGRSIQAGGYGGHAVEEGEDGAKMLIDFKGRSGDFIDQIQFLWM